MNLPVGLQFAEFACEGHAIEPACGDWPNSTAHHRGSWIWHGGCWVVAGLPSDGDSTPMMDWYEILHSGGDPWVIVTRLLFAVVLGAAVGWDREQAGKSAGLRTHMMVAMGAATFALLAFEGGDTMDERYGDRGVDPMRVLQGIVGGLGFLGAGSILKSRNGQEVAGLTTAASIWVAGGLGAAAGMGAVVTGALGAVLSLLILRVVHAIEVAAGKRTEGDDS